MSISFTVAEIRAKIDELKVKIDDTGEQIAFWLRLLAMAELQGAVVEEPPPEQEGEIDPQQTD